MKHTETQLRTLAKENPKELVRVITSPYGDTNTSTSGAEILGEEVSDESLVFPALKILLKHNHALVREGAMIGISAFYSNKSPPRDILDILKSISNIDPLLTNKELAKDLIITFSK